jgi:hypothetical protein
MNAATTHVRIPWLLLLLFGACSQDEASQGGITANDRLGGGGANADAASSAGDAGGAEAGPKGGTQAAGTAGSPLNTAGSGAAENEDLEALAPDGECLERRVAAVTFDGVDLDTDVTWEWMDAPSPGQVTIGAGWLEDGQERLYFDAAFPHHDGELGNFSAQSRDVDFRVSFDGVSIACSGSEVTGTVRVAAIDEGEDAERVCGAYDLGCDDASSGHAARVRVRFITDVPTETVPGR